MKSLLIKIALKKKKETESISPQAQHQILALKNKNVSPSFFKRYGSICGAGDGIPVELFKILKDDAVKLLHSICQQIWKTQQWPQDWKRSVFIPIPMTGNAKECSNYRTIALISHASKVMLKILQARLQQYVNCELPDVHLDFIDYSKAFDCVDHNKLWKILKEKNTRPADLPLEKSVCRSRSDS